MKSIILTTIMVVMTAVACKSPGAQGAMKAVDLTSKWIVVKGANYVNRDEGQLTFSRFSEETLNAPVSDAMFNADKARTNSGIRIFFKTRSAQVCLTFKPMQGQNRGSEFAIYQDSVQTHVFNFKGDKAKEFMSFKFENSSGDETLFEVTLPSFANVALVGMELDEEATLLPVAAQNQPVYLALGNSITHGVGQGSATFLTYPYLLAKALNFDYYNLAVGGAKISPAIARMMREMPLADVITILIGYNDLMFKDKSVEEFSQSYLAYLKEIRHNQPKANIYCITLTHTRARANERTGLTPEDFRIALKHLVYQLQSEGDTKLHLIEGDKITSEANLRPDLLTDKVHFSIDGAALFADTLSKIISY
ncbi:MULTISPECIES: SGNH/GDSL hydrolase family protein [unclassified Carboxylicivirga]|uniref:SGNH/GDSL hydrolase family protein n=1 Tax=Carboxylicivirga TaxID=1628153 RepID=UPI003D3377E3